MARTPRIHPAYRSYSPLFLVMFPSLPTHSSLLPSVVTRSGTGVRKGVKHDECERHASPRKVERLTSRPKRQTCRSLPIPLVHPPERRSEGGRWTRRMGKERPFTVFHPASLHSSVSHHLRLFVPEREVNGDRDERRTTRLTSVSVPSSCVHRASPFIVRSVFLRLTLASPSLFLTTLCSSRWPCSSVSRPPYGTSVAR